MLLWEDVELWEKETKAGKQKGRQRERKNYQEGEERKEREKTKTKKNILCLTAGERTKMRGNRKKGGKEKSK